MARGFVYAIYLADDGRSYLRQVDIDSTLDIGRGWTVWDGVAEVPLWPARAVPRTAFGVSQTTGRRGHTVIGSTGAAIWVGTQPVFTVETNDPDVPRDFLTVTRRRGESFPMRHQIVQPEAPVQA